MKRGKFIVFEGIDFSGKSTQVKLLNKYLQEKKLTFINTREPGGTKFSEKVRDLILYTELDPLTELLLYQASRREHIVKTIIPALNEQKLVISDRFYDSSIAYQAYGRGLEKSIIEQLNKIVSIQNLAYPIKPDLVFFINIPVETMLERIKTRKKLDKFEKDPDPAFFIRVINGFKDLAKQENYYTIDGTQSIDRIHQEVIKIINAKVLGV